jgi:hypothetical protein
VVAEQKTGIPVTGVRVLTLRRGVAPAGRDSPGEQREYHHRWIVRGRQEHRPRWIAPHVKGPDDKPLAGGERAYLLRR